MLNNSETSVSHRYDTHHITECSWRRPNSDTALLDKDLFLSTD